MKEYSIWISKEEDGTYDINVWDEVENDRDDNLEISYVESYEKAKQKLESVINNNCDINFTKLEDNV